MSTALEPRHEVVYLEPRRDQLDRDRERLLATVVLPAALTTPAEYSRVVILEEELTAFIDSTEPMFDEHCSAAYKVWKQACTIRGAFIDQPKQLKAQCRALLGDYKAREAEERRREEQRIAEDQRRQAADQRTREARLLQQSGQPELAEVVRNAPIDMPAVTLPSALPDVPGLTYREDWFWEPVGGDTPTNRRRALGLLVRQEYAQFLKFDDGALTAFARRNKDTVRIPGIRFGSRQIPVRR